MSRTSLLSDPRYRKITEEILRHRNVQEGLQQELPGVAFDWTPFLEKWGLCKDLTLAMDARSAAAEQAIVTLLAPAFLLVREDLMTPTAEFDLIFQPRPDDVIWREYGPRTVVEVDCRSGPAGWDDISSFVHKVAQIKLRLAFYVSVSGFTEDVIQLTKLLNASQSAFRLVTIAGQEIDDFIQQRTPPAQFLSSKLLEAVFSAVPSERPLVEEFLQSLLYYVPPRGGLLANYNGYVSACIVGDNYEPLLLSDDGLPVVKEGQICKLIVAIQKQRPVEGKYEPIRITDGQDRKEVFFSVDFDSPTLEANPVTLSMRVEPENEKPATGEFEIKVTPKGRHNVYIQVRQQMLIQVVRQQLIAE